MPLQDQILKCRDCGKEFVWTSSEQEFYKKKGFDNAPVRCPDCRRARRQQKMGERKMYKIICAQCGKEDQVPFEPQGNRPVLCRDCFQKLR